MKGVPILEQAVAICIPIFAVALPSWRRVKNLSGTTGTPHGKSLVLIWQARSCAMLKVAQGGALQAPITRLDLMSDRSLHETIRRVKSCDSPNFLSHTLVQ